MINTEKAKNNEQSMYLTQFGKDFSEQVKNIETDSDKLISLVRKLKFADIPNKISGDTRQQLTFINDDNVQLTVSVSNARNIAPEIDDRVVSKLNVVSVGVRGNNIKGILRMLRNVNDSE